MSGLFCCHARWRIGAPDAMKLAGCALWASDVPRLILASLAIGLRSLADPSLVWSSSDCSPQDQDRLLFFATAAFVLALLATLLDIALIGYAQRARICAPNASVSTMGALRLAIVALWLVLLALVTAWRAEHSMYSACLLDEDARPDNNAAVNAAANNGNTDIDADRSYARVMRVLFVYAYVVTLLAAFIPFIFIRGIGRDRSGRHIPLSKWRRRLQRRFCCFMGNDDDADTILESVGMILSEVFSHDVHTSQKAQLVASDILAATLLVKCMQRRAQEMGLRQYWFADAQDRWDSDETCKRWWCAGSNRLLTEQQQGQSPIRMRAAIEAGKQPLLPQQDWARIELSKYYARYIYGSYGWGFQFLKHPGAVLCSCTLCGARICCGDEAPRVPENGQLGGPRPEAASCCAAFPLQCCACSTPGTLCNRYSFSSDQKHNIVGGACTRGCYPVSSFCPKPCVCFAPGSANPLCSQSCCHWKANIFLRSIRAPGSHVLLRAQLTTDFATPVFFLARDDARQSLVLTIRGTMSVADGVADGDGVSARMDAWGWPRSFAHRGLLRKAVRVAEMIKPDVINFFTLRLRDREAACKQEQQFKSGFDEWRLVVIGHSLGASVATLVTMILHRDPEWMSLVQRYTVDLGNQAAAVRTKMLQCIAYAPPCVLDYDTCVSPEVRHMVTGIVFENDVIARSCYANVALFRRQALFLTKSIRSHEKGQLSRSEIVGLVRSKQYARVLSEDPARADQLVRDCLADTSQFEREEWARNMDLAESASKTTSTLRDNSIPLRLKSFPAGRLYHIALADRKLESSSWRALARVFRSALITMRRPTVIYPIATASLDELFISASMADDHMPDHYDMKGLLWAGEFKTRHNDWHSQWHKADTHVDVYAGVSVPGAIWGPATVEGAGDSAGGGATLPPVSTMGDDSVLHGVQVQV